MPVLAFGQCGITLPYLLAKRCWHLRNDIMLSSFAPIHTGCYTCMQQARELLTNIIYSFCSF